MRRTPAVAGTFYPADPEELLRTIQHLFNSTSPSPRSDLVAVISPHAGYPYAGRPQAVAIGSLPKETELVILLGPSHYFPLRHLAVDLREEWRTPLGDVEIDQEWGRALLEGSEDFVEGAEYHDPEHSLEVLVPWLQVHLSEFQIVPILVGALERNAFRRAGESLAQRLLQESRPWVLVTSSDLYHGYSYEEGREMDQKTLEVILQRDMSTLLEDHHRGTIMACGIHPIALLLATLETLGIQQGEVLEYTNSLDVLGTRVGYFVGYAAVGFFRHGA